MKIRKLKIKNYKVFDDVEFDFTDKDGNTLDTIVLAGVNGSGKTTVLELINKLVNREIENTEDEADLKKKLKISFEIDIANIINGIDSMEVTFTNSSIFIRKGEIKIDRALDFIDDEDLDTIGIDNFAYLPIKKKNIQLQIGNIHILHLDSHKSEMEKSLLKSVQNEVFKNRNLTLNDSIQKSIEKISHVLRGLKLTTRLVDLDNDSLIFESANRQRVTFEELSNGEQNLYFRAIQLSHLNLKNGLILIDEPEDALHPTWQKEVAKLYQNVGENNQVIMATHSPHVMASVEPKSLFVLHVNDETRKIEVINMEKAGKHTKGLEPNRILREVMELDILRDYDVQTKIDKLAKLLTINEFDKIETQKLAEELMETLGKEDSFIIRMEHQLLMLNRQKMKAADALR